MFYAAFPPEINSGRIYSGSGIGAVDGRRSGLGRAGQRFTVHSGVLFVGDLVPDRRAVARPHFAEHDGRGHSLSELDAGHGRPGRRNRDPGHRRGERL